MKRYTLRDTVSMGEAWREIEEDEDGVYVRFDEISCDNCKHYMFCRIREEYKLEACSLCEVTK